MTGHPVDREGGHREACLGQGGFAGREGEKARTLEGSRRLDEKVWEGPSHAPPPAPPQGCGPEHVLAEGWERMLLVVTEDLKHDGLALDVLDEGLGHLHCNLAGEEHRQKGEATHRGRGRTVREASAWPPRRTGLETLARPDLCPRRVDARRLVLLAPLPLLSHSRGPDPLERPFRTPSSSGDNGQGRLCGLL